MSYGKVVIILRFSGEYYGIRGHNHVGITETLMKYLVCSSIERVKRQDKSSSTTLNMECIIRDDAF